MVECPGDRLSVVLAYLEEAVRKHYKYEPGSVEELLRENPDWSREEAEEIARKDFEIYTTNPQEEEFIWQYGKEPDKIRRSVRGHIDEGCFQCLDKYFGILLSETYVKFRVLQEIGSTQPLSKVLRYVREADKRSLGLME